MGQCPFKGTRLARPTSTREILACADKDTGVLRWPRTGKCWWENTTVKWLAAPASDGASSTTTSSSTTTTSSSTTTTSTTVVTPSVTTTVAPSSNSGSIDTTTTTTPTLPTQTVTWSPTTALTTTQSPNTPLAASSSGDGAITYAVQSAGATGCAINSSTRVLTFTTAGSCVVRATAATTSNYLTGYVDVTFTVTLAAPAFTLSSSSETKAQNVAIAGYTISSTGGTIASYAISPAAPAGLTFNTSTGLLSGTPTTVQAATAYTITATNATGTATATFTLTVTAALTCAAGGTCDVGDTGPGGGKVFYVAATNFTSTGSDCNTACKYLEAAPSDQSTGIAWATTTTKCYALDSTTDDQDCQLNSIYSGTGQAASRTAATAIGKGMANTNQIYTRLTTATYAAGIAWAYTNNGKTDWHLPSKDELNQLYTNRTTVGGFSTASYWSSSEFAANGAWGRSFSNGIQFANLKFGTLCVRPVRAFG